MARAEFSNKTRKQAFKRSGFVCEAIGTWYGLPAGERCQNSLAYGVEYDHIILDANSKDNSLENCAAVCIRCHRFKTRTHDTPLAAKTVAQSLMGKNLRPSQKMPARPKTVSEKRAKALSRERMPLPGPKRIYEERT